MVTQKFGNELGTKFFFSFTFEEKQILHSPNQEFFSTDTFRVATA